MIAKRLALAVLVGLLVGQTAFGQPANPKNKLPRTFTGVYETTGGNSRERVTLTIDKAEEKDGVITFTGSQTYAIYDLKEKATGKIDLKTGKISFKVSDPSKNADTDGVFVGTISPKLDSIRCVWINNAIGQLGTLKLTVREP